MMDDVQSHPASNTLWGGNQRGMWKMIPLQTVVDSTIAGIERRAHMIVPTRQNALLARIPGFIRPLVDRIGFRGNVIPDAIAQATVGYRCF